MKSLKDQIFKQSLSIKASEQPMTANAQLGAVAEVGMKLGKKLMDVNNDGKVDAEDFKLAVKDGKSFTILLMGVISLLASALVFLFTSGDWSMLETVGSIIVIPFIMFVGTKKIFDKMDTEKAELVNSNLALKDKMNEMKREHQSQIQIYEISQKQMEGALDLKNKEIDWLRNGFDPNKITK
jgi:hypothetical protein